MRLQLQLRRPPPPLLHHHFPPQPTSFRPPRGCRAIWASFPIHPHRCHWPSRPRSSTPTILITILPPNRPGPARRQPSPYGTAPPPWHRSCRSWGRRDPIPDPALPSTTTLTTCAGPFSALPTITATMAWIPILPWGSTACRPTNTTRGLLERVLLQTVPWNPWDSPAAIRIWMKHRRRCYTPQTMSIEHHPS